MSSVGYSPPLGELPAALASDSHLFVEQLDALQPSQWDAPNSPPCASPAGQELTTPGCLMYGRFA